MPTDGCCCAKAASTGGGVELQGAVKWWRLGAAQVGDAYHPTCLFFSSSLSPLCTWPLFSGFEVRHGSACSLPSLSYPLFPPIPLFPSHTGKLRNMLGVCFFMNCNKTFTVHSACKCMSMASVGAAFRPSINQLISVLYQFLEKIDTSYCE